MNSIVFLNLNLPGPAEQYSDSRASNFTACVIKAVFVNGTNSAALMQSKYVEYISHGDSVVSKMNIKD